MVSANARRWVFTLGMALHLAWTGAAASVAQETDRVRTGKVHYVPPTGDEQVAEGFRLAEHEFAFQQVRIGDSTQSISVWNVTFPSPVKTPFERNNTVYCEYYEPHREAPMPGVVVLHIMGGDFNLSRLFCAGMASRGVAALFLKMPYYGPREEPGVHRRMVSADPQETVEGMTQAVLDIRRAAAWLESRPEIDSHRLGIFGISLGGITGALAATAEPRLHNVCLVLAGGDIGRITQESTEFEKVRRKWRETGGDEHAFREILSTVDPVRYAANARGRRILMLNALDDEVIPKACTLSLWESLGKPPIVWYSGGHYSVARHTLDALLRTADFFAHSTDGQPDVGQASSLPNPPRR